MRNYKYLNILKTIPFFFGLNEKEILLFIKKSYYREFKKGQHIFNLGEPAENFYILLSGWVKLYLINKEAHETTIALVTKGDVFSEVATFKGSDYPYSALIVGKEATCLIIKAYDIRENVRENPNLALKMLASMSHYSNQLCLSYEHITTLTSSQRLGCFLLKLSMDRNYETNLQLPYNKNLVASRLGMKPETFSRAMKRLEKDLTIEFKGREILISNISQLKKYCEIECFNNDSCNLSERLLCKNPQCDIYRILKLM
jgi:CRP-like cAMP-binding protein